ncbi:MAG: hypothetical protein Q9213_000262 [Squamulea squamosa]
MAGRRRGKKMKPTTSTTSPAQASGAQQRDLTPTSFPHRLPPGTKTIYVGPLFDEKSKPSDSDVPFTIAKAIGVTAVTIQTTLPAVFALETIVK